jgi:hypothetical protein
MKYERRILADWANSIERIIQETEMYRDIWDYTSTKHLVLRLKYLLRQMRKQGPDKKSP